jgi:DNA (cytosine-5)-methyltransferase 1
MRHVSETFVDLSAGAGGLSWELQQAGMTCLLVSDHWDGSLATHRHNMPHHHLVNADIGINLTVSRLKKLLPDKPDWIVGGPPCQGYSTVGKRDRSDTRNVLFLEFRKLVAGIEPKGFLIENVLGLKDMSYEQEVAESLKNLGYRVRFVVLKLADYGVPQLRRRVVFVGHKERGLFQGPPIIHDEEMYVSVADAIFDLPKLRPGESRDECDKPPKTPYQKLMRLPGDTLQGRVVSKHPAHLVKAISFMPDGGNRQSIPPKHQARAGFRNSYSRLASWLPAVAITQNLGKPSGTRCIHPLQHRGLTTREGARLKSFPDSFHFMGGVTSQRLQGSLTPCLPYWRTRLVRHGKTRCAGFEDRCA